MELGVASRHVREHGSDVSRAERERRSDSQAAAKLTGGQDRLPGHVDLGANFGGIVPEGGSGLK